MAAWEKGASQPSFNQVRKAAEIYKRPLAAFFLTTPPDEKRKPPDLRTIHSEDNKTLSPEALLVIRKARRIQEIAAALFDEMGERPTFKYQRHTVEDDPSRLAAQVRTDLGLSIRDQVNAKTYEDFFDYLLANVAYKNQSAIEQTKGRVHLAGTSHLYRVKRVLWPQAVQSVLGDLLIPNSLHVCSGHSLLGDIRVDADKLESPDVVCDAGRLPFADHSFNSVLCDPPYNGRFQWNHDLLSELSRVARRRIIFQHWFMPADRRGRWRKLHKFRMAAVYAWQPKTYFGRAQTITVFDALDEETKQSACDSGWVNTPVDRCSDPTRRRVWLSFLEPNR